MDTYAIFNHKHTGLPAKCVPVIAKTMVGPVQINSPPLEAPSESP